MQRLYPGVTWREDPTKRVVYLTFDDGPIPDITPQVLDILATYGVKATFFMVGENVVKHPDVFQLVVDGGHRVANHTYNHVKGLLMPLSDYMDNVEQAEAVLGDDCYLFRPPYGRMRTDIKNALRHEGYKIVLWDVLTHDYNSKYSADRMMNIIRKYTRNGSIINFHDSLRSGERMLDCLKPCIEWLQAEGYEIKTL